MLKLLQSIVMAAVTGILFGLVWMPNEASAQSRLWLMRQGVYCAPGKRAMKVERCRWHARAAAGAVSP